MDIVAIALFVLSTSGTPGPNNIMLLTSGVNHGVKKSIRHVLGINLGFPIMLVAVGLGAMQVFVMLPWLYQAIKVVGMAYLLFLAYKIANTKVSLTSGQSSKPFSFFQAALFQWVNPKAWIMSVSAIVAFASPDSPAFWQVMTISACYFLFGLPCSMAWLSAGASLQSLLSNERFLRTFNVLMALILVASLMPMASSLLSNTPLLNLHQQ